MTPSRAPLPPQKPLLFLVLVLLLVLAAPGAALARESWPQAEPSVFSCSNVAEVPQSECSALVAFYNSTNGPGWWSNTG